MIHLYYGRRVIMLMNRYSYQNLDDIPLPFRGVPANQVHEENKTPTESKIINESQFQEKSSSQNILDLENIFFLLLLFLFLFGSNDS